MYIDIGNDNAYTYLDNAQIEYIYFNRNCFIFGR